jgi:GNAT superfamily N-acetyltransferase
MAAAARDLQLTEAHIAEMDVLVAERDGVLVGMVAVSDEEAELGWLFVDPQAIGSGVGRALLEAALARAAERGIDAVELDSDPNAESFYVAHGAERIGTAAPGSTGRALPRLRISTAERRDAARRSTPG